MAVTGKIIKDDSTNNASKPVYVKSDGTLADAFISINIEYKDSATTQTFSSVPKFIIIPGVSSNSKVIYYSHISTTSTNPTYMTNPGGIIYFAYVSNRGKTLNWCNSSGSASSNSLSVIAIF